MSGMLDGLFGASKSPEPSTLAFSGMTGICISDAAELLAPDSKIKNYSPDRQMILSLQLARHFAPALGVGENALAQSFRDEWKRQGTPDAQDSAPQSENIKKANAIVGGPGEGRALTADDVKELKLSSDELAYSLLHGGAYQAAVKQSVENAGKLEEQAHECQSPSSVPVITTPQDLGR